MTDEQLAQALKEVDDNLNRLANPDKPLTKEEQGFRGKLLMRKNILTQIREAKVSNNKSAELYNTMIYDMLVSWGEKHPFLMFLAANLLKAKAGIGGFRV